MHQKRKLYHPWNDVEHPGCQIWDTCCWTVPPVTFIFWHNPINYDLAPAMTNVSHMIHSPSIGHPMAQNNIVKGKADVPEQVKSEMAPFHGNVYSATNSHESYRHYLKLIGTRVDKLCVGQRDLRAQSFSNSQLSLYRTDMFPKAKAAYDLSPIAVSYRKTSRLWHDCCTSPMAIVGGVFTIVGQAEMEA